MTYVMCQVKNITHTNVYHLCLVALSHISHLTFSKKAEMVTTLQHVTMSIILMTLWWFHFQPDGSILREGVFKTSP